MAEPRPRLYDQLAAVHCRAGGTVVVHPDYVRETLRPGTEEGGPAASDGRGLRYLEWWWDPDPNDDTYIVDYAFLLRDVTGEVRVVHDRHVEGLFPRARWFEWFEGAGEVKCFSLNPFGREYDAGESDALFASGRDPMSR